MDSPKPSSQIWKCQSVDAEVNLSYSGNLATPASYDNRPFVPTGSRKYEMAHLGCSGQRRPGWLRLAAPTEIFSGEGKTQQSRLLQLSRYSIPQFLQ